MSTPSRYAEIPTAFVQAAALAGVLIHRSEIVMNYMEAGTHTPPSSLPTGMFAVYVFMYGDRCLKVGKAGPKSAARFCSHHYGANRAPSTLAASLLKCPGAIDESCLDEVDVEAKILQKTSRVNFLLPSTYGPFALSLFEAFVQCRLNPVFEGSATQRLSADVAGK